MDTFICLLRGINVGGGNKVYMHALRQLFSDFGAHAVKTYIQTGNILFRGTARIADNHFIEEQLARRFGLSLTAMLFSAQQFSAIVNDCPYIDVAQQNGKSVYISFLDQSPSAEYIAKLTEIAHYPDVYTIRKNVIYLHCPDGYGATTLSNSAFEKILNVRATTRNWNTVNALLKLVNAA